jgi:AcrR family transcriptional regulator
MSEATESERRLATRAADLPPSVSPPGTRGVLLSCALTLFAERGFAGASIRDIASAAGVQPASVYGHFASKELILAEIIEAAHAEHHRRLAAALLDSGAHPVDQLSAVVREHVLVHASFPMLTVVANAELHALSPELARGALEFRTRSEELISGVVQRGTELGVFHPVDVWLALAAIGGMGIRVANWYTADSHLTAAQVADTYAMYACRIVGVDTAPPRVAES